MKLKMGFILVKKICLLILLIEASLTSSSYAARFGSSTGLVTTNLKVENSAAEAKEAINSGEEEILGRKEIHERLLRVNTKDYGRYDPAPSFVKPPFKLIPN